MQYNIIFLKIPYFSISNRFRLIKKQQCIQRAAVFSTCAAEPAGIPTCKNQAGLLLFLLGSPLSAVFTGFLAIESGLVDVREPLTVLRLDTAAGVVTVEAKVEDGVVREVSFLNAPALVLNRGAEIATKEYGMLRVDISWGGNVYAILPAESIGLTIEPCNCGKLISAAQSIARDINQQITICHPELPFVNQVTHVEFSGPPKSAQADIQNCVVALPRVIDRSPCGTGTSAKAALLYEEGKLKVGESFVHESIIGSLFRCEIAEETTVGGRRAIRPRVTGNACIIGLCTWILDPKDPFPEGFVLDEE